MATNIEDIPVELWFSIFSYLEAHDLLRAFINLNYYFQQLITSRQLLYNIQFNKHNYSSLISIIYCSSNSILSQINSLEWIAKPQYGYLPQFLNKNISKFTQLRSLKIEIYPRQTSLICKILPELNLLDHLYIKSENIETLLIKILFTLPSLHRCELISSNTMSNVECFLNTKSNIQRFYLTNISIRIRSTTNSFFDYVPNLKNLEISGTTRTLKNISVWLSNEMIISEKIPKIKIKCNSNRTTIVFFEQFQLIMSNIKYFNLHIYIDIEDEILLERLINDWWTFIQQVEKINIFIEISKKLNQANDQIQQKFLMYENMLLSKIDLLNKSCQIKWSQIDSPVYRFIADINGEK